jgi:hypothetical protein
MATISNLENINIPFFKSKSMQIYLNRRGVPYMSVGGFGAVFRFKDKNNHQFALKCFTSHIKGRDERYKALHDTLQITKFPFMVDFQYVENGINVGKKTFPVVVMEWGQGITLDSAISNDFADDNILQSASRIAGNIYNIVKNLQEWKMGHGDLQEGNLLISDNDKITLIDYDGMFVPTLDGKQSTEIGLANYQHPKRNNTHFNSFIDDFSLLTILFQLSILDSKTWSKLHDDKSLILKKEDHIKPKKSTYIKKGLKSKEPHIKALANLLTDACKKEPLEIKALDSITANSEIMDWMMFTPTPSVDTNFTSIISKVVSLTDSEVNDYEENKIELPAASPEPEPVQENRKDVPGDWGLASNIKKGLIDLFFEEVEEDDNMQDKKDKGKTIKKIKNTFINLIFDEGPEDDDDSKTLVPGKGEDDESQITTTPLADSSDDDFTEIDSENINHKAEEQKEAPEEIQDLSKAKTAPKPEWMKKRKRK